MYFMATALALCTVAEAGPFVIPSSGPFVISVPDAPTTFDQKVWTHERKPVYQSVRHCQNGRCWYTNEITGYEWKAVQKTVTVSTRRALPESASPTPMSEVHRILALLNPKKGEVLVDFGCGDARFLIEAAKKYGCQGLGIEIDLERAAMAQRLVDESGAKGIKIVHGDSTTMNIKADVGVAYLYPATLKKLKPKIEKLTRFASYRHPVDGLQMAQYGDVHVWKRPEETQPAQRLATWGGSQYAGPVCNSSGCRMCNSIRRQLRL